MGIDNGGTFVKAGIIDETGNLVAVSREPIHNQTPKPGFTLMTSTMSTSSRT